MENDKSGKFDMFQHLEYQDMLAMKEGRIHFAGEHTEDPHGWIDTAARTGVRVATEIHLGTNWEKYQRQYG
jgi:L-amino-acid oxidase